MENRSKMRLIRLKEELTKLKDNAAGKFLTSLD
jgi:hypothetical protein